MRTLKPLVGLLLNQDGDNLSASRFVAEITAVEEQPNGKFVAEITAVEEQPNGKIAIEFHFPEKFKQRQDTKIKQLLQVL